jgi:FMN phosphatase YigB (HAD superfamily)
VRIEAVALDLGHTVIDERLGLLALTPHDESRLMPGAREAMERLTLPIAIWANTRVANANDVRLWLERAGLASYVTWVVTSVDANVRKPTPAFFDYALRLMQMGPEQVLFVGNQRNTDIAGGEASGIQTVYLTDAVYRSPDDAPSTAEPTFRIATLRDLPALVASITGPPDEP